MEIMNNPDKGHTKQGKEDRKEGQSKSLRNDLLLIGALFLIALMLLFLPMLWKRLNPNQEAEGRVSLRITVDGELYGTFPLDEDRILSIHQTNVCEIKDGQVRMIRATCPDQICVHSRAITAHGGSIICLPNRVALDIIRDGRKTRDQTLPDAVAG